MAVRCSVAWVPVLALLLVVLPLGRLMLGQRLLQLLPLLKRLVLALVRLPALLAGGLALLVARLSVALLVARLEARLIIRGQRGYLLEPLVAVWVAILVWAVDWIACLEQVLALLRPQGLRPMLFPVVCRLGCQLVRLVKPRWRRAWLLVTVQRC